MHIFCWSAALQENLAELWVLSLWKVRLVKNYSIQSTDMDCTDILEVRNSFIYNAFRFDVLSGNYWWRNCRRIWSIRRQSLQAGGATKRECGSHERVSHLANSFTFTRFLCASGHRIVEHVKRKTNIRQTAEESALLKSDAYQNSTRSRDDSQARSFATFYGSITDWSPSIFWKKYSHIYVAGSFAVWKVSISWTPTLYQYHFVFYNPSLRK